MGLPIGAVEIACNANETLPEFLNGADYRPRDAIATLANAMDVGGPSNVERLLWTYPDKAQLRRQLHATSISDTQIRDTITRYAKQKGEVFCPHTATAVARLDQLREQGEKRSWTVVATAHPAKFEQVVEPLIGRPIATPPPLAAMLKMPAQAQPLAADEAALRAWPQAM